MKYSSEKVLSEGWHIGSQTPVDDRLIFADLADLQNLGSGDTNAYRYFEGMKVFVIALNAEYIWSESPSGALVSSYTYPSGHVSDTVDYSGRSFNFVPVPTSVNLYTSDGSLSGGRILDLNSNNLDIKEGANYLLSFDAINNRMGFGTNTPTSTVDINGKTTTSNLKATLGAGLGKEIGLFDINGDMTLSSIDDLSEDISPDTAADFVMSYDSDLGVHKKVRLNNFSGSTPLNTKGDLYTFNSATTAKLAISSDTLFLTGDSATSTGLKWTSIANMDTIALIDNVNDYLLIWDSSENKHKKTTLSALGGNIFLSDGSLISDRTLTLASNDFNIVEGAVTLMHFDSANQFVGVNTINPTSTFEVDGKITSSELRLTTNAASTLMMFSDALGDSTWSSINDLVADTPDSGADYIMIWDTSAGLHKKILLKDFTSLPLIAKGDILVKDFNLNEVRKPVGADTFFLAADSGSVEGITWSSLYQFDEDLSPDISNDYIMTWDVSANTHKRILLSTVSAGSGIGVYSETLTLVANVPKDTIIIASSTDIINITIYDNTGYEITGGLSIVKASDKITITSNVALTDIVVKLSYLTS